MDKQDTEEKRAMPPPCEYSYSKYQRDVTCPCTVELHQQWQSIPHFHDYLELVIVLSGGGLHCQPDGRRRISEGNVFSVRPGQCHWYEGAKNLMLANVMVMPAALAFAEQCDWSGSMFCRLFRPGEEIFYTRLSPAQVAEVQKVLTGIITEQKRRLPGHILAIQAHFEELAVLLSRCGLGTSATTESARRLGQMLQFMLLHFSRDITREDIGNAADCSVRTANRIFAEQLQSTPGRELAKIRMTQATYLLQDSRISISEVSRRCGFRDSNYFTLCFTRHYGVSPRRFRHNYQPG